MPERNRCSHLTLRGWPCRNPATLDSDPPACALHSRQTMPGLDERQPIAMWDASAVASPTHLYLPRPSADELRVLESTGSDTDLQPEVDLVRVVLRRLLVYLDETAGELPPEELRRISALVFSGARTVALLLGKRNGQPTETQQWMEAVLDELGKKYSRHL